jgi:hypothetical protein
MDPHWFSSPGSGSVLGMLIQIQEQGNVTKFENDLDKKGVFCAILLVIYIKYIFHVKTQLLVVTAKSEQDPDPYGSALVWLSGS